MYIECVIIEYRFNEKGIVSMNTNGKEKVIVIGGGVAGLSAGIYALLSGFDAEIYEKNAIPEVFPWQLRAVSLRSRDFSR